MSWKNLNMISSYLNRKHSKKFNYLLFFHPWNDFFDFTFRTFARRCARFGKSTANFAPFQESLHPFVWTLRQNAINVCWTDVNDVYECFGGIFIVLPLTLTFRCYTSTLSILQTQTNQFKFYGSSIFYLFWRWI